MKKPVYAKGSGTDENGRMVEVEVSLHTTISIPKMFFPTSTTSIHMKAERTSSVFVLH